jgi:organic hydroperoxide reductase OsmC/OhrA
MNQMPFRYAASASAHPEGDVTVEAVGVTTIPSAPPPEFGGPGDRWSPETLLVAAVADCFVLTFRAVARASKLPWTSITCTADGILERVDRIPQFTNFTVTAHLWIPRGTDPSSASSVLAKAKQACLISQSLKAATHLELRVEEDDSPADSSEEARDELSSRLV